IAVRRDRISASTLSCFGAKCCTKMNARPGLSGRCPSSCPNASRPPADAPMPTIGNEPGKLSWLELPVVFAAGGEPFPRVGVLRMDTFSRLRADGLNATPIVACRAISNRTGGLGENPISTVRPASLQPEQALESPKFAIRVLGDFRVLKG